MLGAQLLARYGISKRWLIPHSIQILFNVSSIILFEGCGATRHSPQTRFFVGAGAARANRKIGMHRKNRSSNSHIQRFMTQLDDGFKLIVFSESLQVGCQVGVFGWNCLDQGQDFFVVATNCRLMEGSDPICWHDC